MTPRIWLINDVRVTTHAVWGPKINFLFFATRQSCCYWLIQHKQMCHQWLVQIRTQRNNKTLWKIQCFIPIGALRKVCQLKIMRTELKYLTHCGSHALGSSDFSSVHSPYSFCFWAGKFSKLSGRNALRTKLQYLNKTCSKYHTYTKLIISVYLRQVWHYRLKFLQKNLLQLRNAVNVNSIVSFTSFFNVTPHIVTPSLHLNQYIESGKCLSLF